MQILLKRLMLILSLVVQGGCTGLAAADFPALKAGLVNTLKAPFTADSSSSEADPAAAELVPGSTPSEPSDPVAARTLNPVVNGSGRPAGVPEEAQVTARKAMLRTSRPAPERIYLAHAGYPAERFPSPRRPPGTGAGSGDSAGRVVAGAGGGALLGGLLGGHVIAACLASGPFAPMACPPAIGIVAGGALLGGLAASQGTGGANADTVVYVPPRRPDARSAQTALAAAARDYLAADGALRPVMLNADAGPQLPRALPDYRILLSAGPDRLLETRMLNIGFISESRQSKGIALALAARARLIHAGTRNPPVDLEFGAIGDVHTADDWAAMDQQRFGEELQRAYRRLARKIVDALLLEYPSTGEHESPPDTGESRLAGASKFITGAWNSLTGIVPAASAGQRAQEENEAAPYGNPRGLRALQPGKASWTARWCAPWSDACDRTPAGQGFAEAGSRRPLLRWEAFPQERDRDRAGDGAPERISGVSYQLRIYAAPRSVDGVWPAAGPPRVDRQQAGTRFRPRDPLEACTRYYWTVRARFRLDGRVRTTPWSGTFAESPDQARRLRLAGLDRDEGGDEGASGGPRLHWPQIPASHYFAFKTPCQESPE